jgi:hypothetical protein
MEDNNLTLNSNIGIRIAVVGSRKFNNYPLLKKTLNKIKNIKMNNNLTLNSNSGIRIAVVGSRTFDNYSLLEKTLDKIKNIEYIVSGGSIGADKLAEKYAEEHKIEIIIFLPEWDKYGNRAEPVRNEKIITNYDKTIAFWDGKSKGTLLSINISKKLNKKLFINIIYIIYYTYKIF